VKHLGDYLFNEPFPHVKDNPKAFLKSSLILWGPKMGFPPLWALVNDRLGLPQGEKRGLPHWGWKRTFWKKCPERVNNPPSGGDPKNPTGWNFFCGTQKLACGSL